MIWVYLFHMIWSHQHIVFTAMLKLTKCLDLQHNNNNNHFTALCPGLPGWAGTRRNTHPPTILIIIQSLPASSIYHDPQHPHCSNYVLGNLFAQPLSKSSLVYLLFWCLFEIQNNVDAGKLDRSFAILYTSIRSALFLRSSKVFNPSRRKHSA